MKISNMTRKTSWEVSPDDLLVIEDEQDTKAITAAEFTDFFNHTSERYVKLYMNQLFDRIIRNLTRAKFVVAKQFRFAMNIWIDEPGIVNIALADMGDSHWLTSIEIGDIFVDRVPEFTATVGIRDIKHSAWSIEEYPLPETDVDGNEIPDDTLNPAFVEAKAGYIRVEFPDIDQNYTATITHKDIRMRLVKEDGTPPDPHDIEETVCWFKTSEEGFSNNVPFESRLPVNSEPDETEPDNPVIPDNPVEPGGDGDNEDENGEPGGDTPEVPENPDLSDIEDELGGGSGNGSGTGEEPPEGGDNNNTDPENPEPTIPSEPNPDPDDEENNKKDDTDPDDNGEDPENPDPGITTNPPDPDEEESGGDPGEDPDMTE